MLRPQGHREELVKALPRELVKAPPRAYLVFDTQVTQKRVLIGVVRATWTIATRQRRDGKQTAQRGGNTGKALGSGNTGQLRGPTASKATHRRVLIGVVHAT